MRKSQFVKQVFKIIGETERDIKEIYNKSSLEKPIRNDLVLSKRNMAYNEIKAIAKKYKEEKEDE